MVLFVVCQRIPTYYSVFVTCLKRMSNEFSVHQRTCLISHTSAYAGNIRRSVTGPLDYHFVQSDLVGSGFLKA